jgi:hypothetical protein
VDSDPAFRPMWIWIQVFDDQKFKISLLLLHFLSLGPHGRRPSYRRSLKASKENILHFITWNFFTFFKHLKHETS